VALPRDEVVAGTTNILGGFEELIRSLDDKALNTPTRCEGWVVRDVAAHAIGTMTLVATGQLQEFADPTHVDRQVAERKGRSGPELADELRDDIKIAQDLLAAFDDAAWTSPPPIDIPGTLGDAVEAIWYDTYVHTEDILAALGRPPAHDRDGLRVAVSHISVILDSQNWGPATIALDGIEEFKVGDGSGKRVTGDPLDFVLAATGRGNPAALGLDETVNIYRPQ
jgi:uncharacterized protein (TIGR03083 family)